MPPRNLPKTGSEPSQPSTNSALLHNLRRHASASCRRSPILPTRSAAPASTQTTLVLRASTQITPCSQAFAVLALSSLRFPLRFLRLCVEAACLAPPAPSAPLSIRPHSRPTL